VAWSRDARLGLRHELRGRVEWTYSEGGEGGRTNAAQDSEQDSQKEKGLLVKPPSLGEPQIVTKGKKRMPARWTGPLPLKDIQPLPDSEKGLAGEKR